MTTAPFDFQFVRHLSEQGFRILNHEYFRARIIGLDHVPPRTPGRPRIFYSNHSGMAFPWDAIVFNTLYWEQRGYGNDDLPRPLVAAPLMRNRLMNPYMIENLWARGGCVEASLENFEVIMNEGRDVVIYPEGVPGIGKGFDKRYQIQKFSTSFLRMAMQFDAELIPFHTINAEYLHPFSYKNDTLNRYVQKLGIPFLPVSPLTALVGMFPWMFYFALPANIHYVFGKPIQPKELTGKSWDVLQRSDYIRMRDEVHSDFQRNIEEHVEEFGRDPYHMEEFRDRLMSDAEKALFVLPTGWPILITGLQRLYDEGVKKELMYTVDEFVSLAAKAVDGLSFSLPFSWPLVFGLKGFTGNIIDGVVRLIQDEIGAKPAPGLHKVPAAAQRRDAAAAAGRTTGQEGKPPGEIEPAAPPEDRSLFTEKETSASFEEALRLMEEAELDKSNLDQAEMMLLRLGHGENLGRALGLLSWVQYLRGMEADASEKLAIYELGVEYGEKAVAADDSRIEGHFWLAVNYGLLGETKGILESLFLVKPIEKHLQRALAIDESYFYGAAHRAMGWVLHRLPPWPLSHGDNKEALEHLEKALRFGPDFPLNRIYAAEILLSLKKKHQAKSHLEWVVEHPLSANHAREEAGYKERAKELLRSL